MEIAVKIKVKDTVLELTVQELRQLRDELIMLPLMDNPFEWFKKYPKIPSDLNPFIVTYKHGTDAT